MSLLVGLDGAPLESVAPVDPPDADPEPEVTPEPPAPEPAADDAPGEPDGVGEPLELNAVRRFYEAITRGAPAEEVITSLDTALQFLSAAHAMRFPDGLMPVHGTDYQIKYAPPPAPGQPPTVLIEDLTPTGALLGEIWNTYQREVEYSALKTHTARLTQIVERLVAHQQTMQQQLDNAMMDFNKIRRKIKA